MVEVVGEKGRREKGEACGAIDLRYIGFIGFCIYGGK
jgi:hypothetical protein